MELQKLLFRRVRSRIPAHLAAENEVAKLLSISLEEAFKLMRCVSAISLDQAEKLAATYSIALDNLRPQSPTFLPFQYNAINYNMSSLEEYFDSVMDEIKNIDLYGTRQLYYAASDLPVFALFQFAELSAFKLFYWGKHVYDLPAFSDAKFAIRHFPQESLASAERSWKQYLKIPSVEVWSSEVINNILREVFTLWQRGEFLYRSDALLICDQIGEMIDHIAAQAACGKKFHPYMPLPTKENYTLYYNEIGINNNALLVRSDTGTTAYVCQNELNFLHTENEIYCLQTQRWFFQLMGNSELISQTNTELRERVFAQMHQNVAYVKAQIK